MLLRLGAPAGAHSRRRTPRDTAFRPDVEGMRAVAIVAVVGYHAAFGGFAGGFVGVDVFFVLSGFLITGLLWQHISRTGTIRLADFYARRARRLLPAAVLVILVTVVASAELLSPLRVPSVTDDGISALFYGANYRFALQSTNYLNSSGTPSPLQHYWSLGVEEQFYLVWPLLMLGVAMWCRRRGRSPARAPLAGVLVLLAGVSFACSWWLTGADQPWAFFSLPARAWELAVGGLVALGSHRLARLPPAFAGLLGWSGIGVVVVTVVALSPRVAFPGTTALAPVLGTAAVLAAGCANAARGPSAALSAPPLQWLGRHPYSWYLWHWPTLVLAGAALGHSPDLAGRAGAVAVSLVLAVLTARLVERPIRFSAALGASPLRSLTAGAAIMTAGTAAVIWTGDAVTVPVGHRVAPVAHAPSLFRGAPAGHVGLQADRAAVPTSVDPLAAAQAAAQADTAQVATAVAASTTASALPANLQPPLSLAASSEATPLTDGCFDGFTDAAVHTCTYGAPGASRTIAVFGDSHAMMWYPAFDRIATGRGWQLEMFGKGTCPPVNAPLVSAELGRPFYECERWRTSVLGRLRNDHPAVVVLAMTRNYGGPYVLTSYSRQWISGLASMVQDIRAIGSRVVVLGPVPQPPSDVPSCLADHPPDVAACALDASTALDAGGIAAEEQAVAAAGGTYLDVRPWFCTSSACPVVVDNLLVFRDMSHITVPYAAFLAGAMDASLYVATAGTV